MKEDNRPYRHGKVCVISVPARGESWINKVMGEMDNVNDYISIPSGEKWDDPTPKSIIEDIQNTYNDIMSEGYIKNEPKICPECFMVSEATSVFVCPHCGHIESTRGALGYKLRFLNERLHHITDNLHAAITYTLPRFTFRDHWNDCFGWLTEKRPEAKAKSWTEILFDDWLQKTGLL